MAKREKRNYNLNSKKGSKIILLILALSFIAVPVIMLIVHLISLATHPFL